MNQTTPSPPQNWIAMNREIKFRVWIERNDDWNIEPHMAVQGEPDIPTLDSFMNLYSNQKHLMQFTGLHDKDGKEIYEGDIVEYEGWHGGVEYVMLEKRLASEGKPPPNYMERRVILGHPYGHYIMRELDNIADMTYTGNCFNHSPSTSEEWQVIGNIYEHPHLIKP